MKEEDSIKGEALERIDDELFGSFDPESEFWLIGGSYTLTGGNTYSPSGPDGWRDLDNLDLEAIRTS
jgi:hypothetical protein